MRSQRAVTRYPSVACSRRSQLTPRPPSPTTAMRISSIYYTSPLVIAGCAARHAPTCYGTNWHGDGRMNEADEVVTLYRPVGQKELDLIRESGFQAFPPRLPQQPIFYPVLSEGYALQI